MYGFVFAPRSKKRDTLIATRDCLNYYGKLSTNKSINRSPIVSLDRPHRAWRPEPNHLTTLHLTNYGNIEYKYDPLGRRLSKTIYIDIEDPDIEYYLYDDMEEIATLNETGAISDRKILGLNNRTVMIETQHDIFVTMVDAHNNIRKLVDHTNGATIQSYYYYAFHELHPQYDSLTRYRFASRQTDPENRPYLF